MHQNSRFKLLTETVYSLKLVMVMKGIEKIMEIDHYRFINLFHPSTT